MGAHAEIESTGSGRSIASIHAQTVHIGSTHTDLTESECARSYSMSTSIIEARTD